MPHRPLARNGLAERTIWDLTDEAAMTRWAWSNPWQHPVKIRDQRVDPRPGPLVEGFHRPARRRLAGYVR